MKTPPRRQRKKTAAGSRARPRRRSASTAHRPQHEQTSGPAAWGLLVYLAGDLEKGHEAIRDDLHEILAAGSSPDLQIVVQHDGPEGAARYIVPPAASPAPAPAHSFGRLDSGSSAALLDFLRWGLSVCRAERLALVLGSPLVVSPAEASSDPDRVSVFSLTHDSGSGNYLDVCDMAGTIRRALRDAGREQLDLVAIDSCDVQFLELAYELEDIVRILIAPQTTIPAAGWDYVRILSRWKALAARRPHIGTRDLASALLEEIAECYRSGEIERSVSALDLQRLDEVANAFDTLCIGTLQVLGEGLIWVTRELLLSKLKETSDVQVYDCGSFFTLWGAALDAMADEAYQGWLGKTLERQSGSKLDAFCEAVARHLEGTLESANGRRNALAAARVELLIATLRAPAPDRQRAGTDFLTHLGTGVRRRLELLGRNAAPRAAADEALVAKAREAAVRAAITQARHLLPSERQFDLDRAREAAESARLLARQSHQANLALLGDPSTELSGLVLDRRATPSRDTGWPRWSGVSMYRPSKLDEMMHEGYTRFTFHQRVHWAALLGAANLIEQHPRALWRLVSSLLATGSAGTRRDVLHRLTGADSVIWGLRDQFKVMAPAPTLTLSLERRSTHVPRSLSEVDAPRENYLLRLESITRGAVITEQRSRVQPDVMDRALHELNELLKQEVTTGQSLADLRSIGGLLGEDVFQSLGRTLEEERRAVRDESPELTPHLQLQIPRELMQYPWELLHHHGEWLGERYAMGRQVFMETGLARRVPSRRQGRVRALVIGDPLFDPGPARNWRQLAGARDEAEQVAGWFERNSREVGSVIEFNRARDTRIHCRLTSAELRALLREGRYDIVHFAGHGVFRADDPETSAWLLSDGELWSLEIRNTLAEHSAPPWLVYANACEAGMDAARPERKYQGNVFGLATAFINQGVAAYIAPLWPIDDLLAQHIALEFYRQLLSERATLGEALRRAKTGARVVAFPGAGDPARDRHAVWAGLGWASLVLYGDPTEELYQALAGGSHQARRQQTVIRHSDAAAAGRSRPAVRPSAARPISAEAANGLSVLHAPDHIVAQWVEGPTWRRGTPDRRGANALADGEVVLELIEDAGLRRWRVRRDGAAGTRGANGRGDGLPGSQLAALLADDRIRNLLPARRGVMRVVGRWIVSGLKDGTLGLVREYDREQVKQEGLLVVNGTGSSELVRADRAEAAAQGNGDRALVFVHGTFSSTASPVDGFGPELIAWAREHYRVVLGLDHWTLSKTPEQNAQLLVDELRAYDAGLMSGGRLDIVTHSRGGLVARSFSELLGHGNAVRNLIFIGTPNCGTDLANPKNWGSFADLLVNMTGVDGAELFGRMAGLLARLAIGNVVSDVPGLLAQNPETAATAGSFLNRLQKARLDRRRIRYGVICSDFEPATLMPNLKKILKSAVDAGVDVSLDALFAGANDLVVNTAHAWGIGRGPGELANLPDFLPGSRVLVYGPPRPKAPPAQVIFPPRGVTTEEALGVHHTNLFSQRRVREVIKEWLSQG